MCLAVGAWAVLSRRLSTATTCKALQLDCSSGVGTGWATRGFTAEAPRSTPLSLSAVGCMTHGQEGWSHGPSESRQSRPHHPRGLCPGALQTQISPPLRSDSPSARRGSASLCSVQESGEGHRATLGASAWSGLGALVGTQNAARRRGAKDAPLRTPERFFLGRYCPALYPSPHPHFIVLSDKKGFGRSDRPIQPSNL